MSNLSLTFVRKYLDKANKKNLKVTNNEKSKLDDIAIGDDGDRKHNRVRRSN